MSERIHRLNATTPDPPWKSRLSRGVEERAQPYRPFARPLSRNEVLNRAGLLRRIRGLQSPQGHSSGNTVQLSGIMADCRPLRQKGTRGILMPARASLSRRLTPPMETPLRHPLHFPSHDNRLDKNPPIHYQSPVSGMRTPGEEAAYLPPTQWIRPVCCRTLRQIAYSQFQALKVKLVPWLVNGVYRRHCSIGIEAHFGITMRLWVVECRTGVPGWWCTGFGGADYSLLEVCLHGGRRFRSFDLLSYCDRS